MVKRLVLATAVLAAAVAIFLWAALPPKQYTLAKPFDDGTVAGVLHVHSVASDGRGTIEQIAHDAARAGLRFVVITDHGDATRPLDPPAYREGVLCIEGTEISTTGGHYIAIDMPPAPYPLGGDPHDVVDDVKRLGGFGIVAHPDSPKPELRWKAWDAPFDGMEIINLDTAWRERVASTTWRAKAGLISRVFTYAVRPAESIASLVSRSTAFPEWEALARRRHVVALAGADAHAQIAWRASDPIAASVSVPIPSYESSFRAVSVHVRPERPLTGTAAVDAPIVVRAIRAGHLYAAIDGIATPPAFELTATNALGSVREGDQLAIAGPVKLHIRSNMPDGFTATIWNGASVLARGRREQDFTVDALEAPAVLWAEIYPPDPRSTVPWITSNAIYVRSAADAPAARRSQPPATSSQPLFDGQSVENWTIEHDDTSMGAVDVASALSGEKSLRVRFGLASGSPANRFTALGVATPHGIAPDDRLTFTARAEHPMRISVQLRTDAARWQRSVYVDTFNQPHTLFFDDFVPAGETSAPHAPLADVRSILFVVDTTNTKPGTSGRIWITSPALER